MFGFLTMFGREGPGHSGATATPVLHPATDVLAWHPTRSGVSTLQPGVGLVPSKERTLPSIGHLSEEGEASDSDAEASPDEQQHRITKWGRGSRQEEFPPSDPHPQLPQRGAGSPGVG